MPVMENPDRLGRVGRGRTRWAAFEYDFATDGGTVGAHTLRGGTLPAGTVILDAIVKTVTPLTSGGLATVAVKIEGGADIQAATAFDAAPFAAAGAEARERDRPVERRRSCSPSARSVVATVAVAALTAGKFVVLVEYVVVKD
jgi:hypothetical protein